MQKEPFLHANGVSVIKKMHCDCLQVRAKLQRSEKSDENKGKRHHSNQVGIIDKAAHSNTRDYSSLKGLLFMAEELQEQTS